MTNPVDVIRERLAAWDKVVAVPQLVNSLINSGYHPDFARLAANAPEDINTLLGLLEWKPIESAPKDGTDVEVRLDVGGQEVIHIAWYRSKDEWEQSGQYCGGWDTLDEWEGWWSYTENCVSQSKLEGACTPKEWRPRPQPPAQGGGDGY